MNIFKNKRKIIGTLLMTALLTAGTTTAFAEPTQPEVEARAAVLYDTETGKVLYGKDENKRMYPASMTKILTAIEFLEHFSIDENIMCGDEVYKMPYESSAADNKPGDVFTVENLLRALIIPSGNDTACVIARAVAKRELNDENISYEDAEQWFCSQMNKKAVEIGCTDTNFVNPHGFHDSRHYTTAYDMALISAYAMAIPDFARIAGEDRYYGDSAEQSALSEYPQGRIKNCNWKTHNDLIDTNSRYYYKGATGIKTGFHDDAGYCVASSATKDGRELIAIVMFSGSISVSNPPERWVDSENMFEYGFNNFSMRFVQDGDIDLGEIEVTNADPEGPQTTRYMAYGSEEKKLFSNEEYARIEKTITFNEMLIAEPSEELMEEEPNDVIRLAAPIEEGQIIGSVVYTLDGEIIYDSGIVALDAIVEAPPIPPGIFGFLVAVKDFALSLYAIPVYVGIVALIVIIIILRHKSKKNRHRNSLTLRKRY